MQEESTPIPSLHPPILSRAFTILSSVALQQFIIMLNAFGRDPGLELCRSISYEISQSFLFSGTLVKHWKYELLLTVASQIFLLPRVAFRRHQFCNGAMLCAI